MNPVPPSIPEHLAAQLAEHVNLMVQIYCRLLAEHDQHDVAQDTLVALVERLHDGGRLDDPFTWVMAVIHKLHAMRCRGRRRDTTKTSLSQPEGADDGPTRAHEPACRGDPWAELDQLLDEVTPPYTEADKAELRAFAAGQSRREIARELGESAEAVRVRIKKNLERLRFFIERGKV